jgi:hypothetical protein
MVTLNGLNDGMDTHGYSKKVEGQIERLWRFRDGPVAMDFLNHMRALDRECTASALEQLLWYAKVGRRIDRFP